MLPSQQFCGNGGIVKIKKPTIKKAELIMSHMDSNVQQHEYFCYPRGFVDWDVDIFSFFKRGDNYTVSKSLSLKSGSPEY